MSKVLFTLALIGGIVIAIAPMPWRLVGVFLVLVAFVFLPIIVLGGRR